jgi:small subunit ribosomal protein S7
MPRRNRPPKRKVIPDARYNSVLLSQFVNKLMQKGKRSLATRIMYDTIEMAGEKLNKQPLEVLEEAVRNVSPVLEVKPRRVGGSTYQIPMEVPPRRQVSLAIRWLLAAARSRPGKTMAEKLSAELVDAASGTGNAVKKREDTHRMAEANRAFAHYRW